MRKTRVYRTKMALCLASRQEKECGGSGSESEPISSCLRNLGGVRTAPRLQLRIGDSSDNPFFDRMLSYSIPRFLLLKKSFQEQKKAHLSKHFDAEPLTCTLSRHCGCPWCLIDKFSYINDLGLCWNSGVLAYWNPLGAGCNWKLTRASLVERFPNRLVRRG